MREVTRDEKWGTMEQPIVPEVTPDPPTEAEMVIISLLMRLYDVNMALLSVQSKNTADEVYEAHSRGEHFNPPIFVPEIGTNDPS